MWNSTLQRKTPMSRGAPLARTSGIKRRAPKKRAGHEPKYLAVCKGESCFLNLPGCRRIPGDDTVVPAHQNQGKGMGLKVADKFTVPACFHCHTQYDQSGLDRSMKRAAWDWAYSRWDVARARKMGVA